MHIIIDPEAFFGQARPKLGHIIDGFRKQPDHCGIEFSVFEIDNIDIDNRRIGTDHLIYKVLVQRSAFPMFYVDPLECPDVTIPFEATYPRYPYRARSTLPFSTAIPSFSSRRLCASRPPKA